MTIKQVAYNRLFLMPTAKDEVERVLEGEMEKKDMDNQKNEKKQIPLRLSKNLFQSISQWAEEEFRSLNGQIEHILSEAVRKKYKK